VENGDIKLANDRPSGKPVPPLPGVASSPILSDEKIERALAILSNDGIRNQLMSMVRSAIKEDIDAVREDLKASEKRLTIAIEKRPTKPTVVLR
jgi:hypothetical protein